MSHGVMWVTPKDGVMWVLLQRPLTFTEMLCFVFTSSSHSACGAFNGSPCSENEALYPHMACEERPASADLCPSPQHHISSFLLSSNSPQLYLLHAELSRLGTVPLNATFSSLSSLDQCIYYVLYQEHYTPCSLLGWHPFFRSPFRGCFFSHWKDRSRRPHQGLYRTQQRVSCSIQQLLLSSSVPPIPQPGQKKRGLDLAHDCLPGLEHGTDLGSINVC